MSKSATNATQDFIDPNSIKVISKLIGSSYSLIQNQKSPKKDNPKAIETAIRIKSLLKSFFHDFQQLKGVLSQDYQKQVFLKIQDSIERGNARNIGISLLNSRSIESPIYHSKIVNHLTEEYWMQIQENAFSQDLFTDITSKLNTFYKKHMNQLIEKELEKVPIQIDESIEREFTKQFYKSRLSFQDFLDMTKEKEGKEKVKRKSKAGKNETETDKLRKDFEAALKKKKLKQLKKKQIESFDNYEQYFDMNDREIRRAKRSGEIKKRKYGRNTRRKQYYSNTSQSSTRYDNTRKDTMKKEKSRRTRPKNSKTGRVRKRKTTIHRTSPRTPKTLKARQAKKKSISEKKTESTSEKTSKSKKKEN